MTEGTYVEIEIPLGRSGLLTVIDNIVADDYRSDLVRAHRWFKLPAGRTAYARCNLRLTDGRRSTRLLHSALTGWLEVDHIDHNGLNNRRSNLRPATSSENGCNTRSQLGSTSQYLGVHWSVARGRWVAEIRVEGRSRHLGRFVDEIDAALAYDRAARQHHGTFANPNFT